MDDLDDTSRWRSSKQVGQMHDQGERLSRFRRELLVAATRVRQELQPERADR
jgi:hypothetical protein